MSEVIVPPPNIWVQFSDCGQHIRRWSREAFEGGHSYGMSEIDRNAAAMAAYAPHLSALDIDIDNIGGNCPVQAEGTFGDLHFYFRARGQTWQFHVADAEEKLLTADEICNVIKPYTPTDGREVQYAAGWMTEAEALAFIIAEVTDFRARRAEAAA